MTALGIILAVLLLAMFIFYIAMKHEHWEEQRTEAYLFRHKYDADKQQATDFVAAAYEELVCSGILQ